ncbi:TPA: winged helix DNA-binding protein [Staphylococcus aureus]|uniref:MarR family winged helix-turn-helix transcriptional regulator n=1 Tax=Staphylococcus aureus TaxID=1280 RepID=UPI000E00F02A|nr:MarR family transcriptional regulator [Staphylococcus aureus]QSV02519.1 winged helix DNA-binding protein [Staphylococcus aureus]SUL36263.1 MarR family regulatory protein [Staphylococcus aureus]HDJ3425745.1 winged helix DNA-binding protein [Staphylococcus aureus]HDJ3536022.1 winged helix DNA-binding protein [Staphylococcus aureus]HDJ3545005.1 winged helix DNA-binding protein [Staphylococcus aureus]
MLSQEFFNSFITIYRPYLKLAEPILEKHNIYYGQWLILRDIAKHQPTTLIEISHRRAIEKPTARKTLKALIENDLITVENSLEDKRQKFLTLTPKGHELYEIVCLDVQKLQQTVVAKTNISQDQMQETINVMNQIHEILLKEAHND